MGTGAITGYVDVAQLVLYAFWIFFAGLIYYLLRENHREGYPLDTDRGVQEGWPPVPSPKTYRLANGHEVQVPTGKPEPEIRNAQALHRSSGSPLTPVGDPMQAGVGPGAWVARADEVDVDYHGGPKIIPLRSATGMGVSGKDPDPRGMDAFGADGEVAGKVVDLWLDAPEMLFRYLEVEIPGGRRVLMPMTFTRVTFEKVSTTALLASQFAGIPATKAPDRVTMLEEEKIGAYFGGGMLYATPERSEPLL